MDSPVFDILFSRIMNIQYAEKLTKTNNTSFVVLEADVQSFANPGLYIIAGDSQSGKTSFVISLINTFRYFEKQNHVAVLSTDMSSSAWLERYLSNLTEIWLEKIQRGKLDDSEIKLLQSQWVRKACNKLQLNAVRFERENQMINYFSKLRFEKGSNIFFIDSIRTLFMENRYSITRILNTFKKICSDVNISIVATCEIENNNSKSKIFRGLEFYADALFFINAIDFKRENAYVRVQKNNFGTLQTFEFRPLLHIQKFEDRNL